MVGNGALAIAGSPTHAEAITKGAPVHAALADRGPLTGRRQAQPLNCTMTLRLSAAFAGTRFPLLSRSST
jgi:hypothetical protein